jgi:hypothetical protein
MALSMLPLAGLHMNRPCRRVWPASRRLLAMAAAAAAAGATSQAQRPPLFLAYWEIPDGVFSANVGCAQLSFWVAKSGKTGLGVTMRTLADEPGCVAQVSDAAVHVAGQTIHATLPPAAEPLPGKSMHVYMPFLFDNETAWKEGVDEADLDLTFSSPLRRNIRVHLRQRVTAHSAGKADLHPTASPTESGR